MMKTQRLRNSTLRTLCVLACAFSPPALAQVSIDWYSIGSGGASAGGAFAVSGTIGQLDPTLPIPTTLPLTGEGLSLVGGSSLPPDLVWTNLAGGDWNVASNWNPNMVPTTNHNAIINLGVTVTVNAPAECFGFTLGGFSTAPTLAGSGTLKIRGPSAWVNGVMGGSGRTCVERGATLIIANPSGFGALLTTRTMENGGTVLWTGTGNIAINSGAVITNRPGALFHVQNASSFVANVVGGRIDNAGTFRKSGNSGTTTVGNFVSFNNSGMVDIQAGTLSLEGGGLHDGSFIVPVGAALVFAAGTHTANASSSITGAGQLSVSGGTANLAGLVNVSGSNAFSRGTANFSGNTICTNNTLNFSNGGTANFSGTGLVSPAVVDLNNGTLSGTTLVTVSTAMHWSQGSINDAGRLIIAPGATLNIDNPSGFGAFLNTRTLENGGTVLWTGTGNIVINSGAVITNRPGALFHVQNAASFLASVVGGRIDNAGTFRKSGNGDTTTVGNFVGFNNSGIVDIQTGTFELGGGGTHNGSFIVSVGAALAFAGGTHTANASSSITGAGQLSVRGGTANLAGLVNVSGRNTFSRGTANFSGNTICTNNTLAFSNGGTANFSSTGLVSPAVVDLNNGALGGTNPVTVSTAMHWSQGSINDAGRLIIAPGATLNIDNASGFGAFLNTRTLENGGTVLWTGTGNILINSGAVITNRPGALFHVQNAASIVASVVGGRIDNAGTFRKSGNSGTTTVGNFVSFNNSGMVDIRHGSIAANGGYTSTSGALLNCALGGTAAGAGFGQLQVAGAVALNGALGVDLINGFVPATNDAFTVLTAGTRNGSFANFSYPSNAVTMRLNNTANSAIVRVTDVFVVPQPAAVPAGLISWWRAEGNALDTFGTNHGALTNGVSFASGQVGQTVAFDGADDYVHVSDSVSLRPMSVTIEAWVKFFATNGTRIVLVKPFGSGAFDSYGLALQDGAVLAAICDDSGFGPFLTGPANTVTGQWHHLAYTFNDTNKQQTLYVNGVAVASGTANKTISYDSHPLLLGADMENGALSFFHHGQIDEASIYNRALTTDEIASIYNAGAAGKQLPGNIPQPLLLTPEIVGAKINIQWTSVSNATYRLEFNPHLANLPTWNAVPGDITATKNTASKLDALTTSNRFYRVRILP